MKRKLFLTLIACLLAVSPYCPPAAAQESDASSRVDFSVKAHLPENQIDKRQSYFDLRVEPGQTQTLQVRVFNNASAPLVVDVELNTASTNPGGVIDYSRPGIRDESMKIAISDLAYVAEPKLTVPPNDSRVAVIGITMPDERFDGVLLGGIQIKQSVDESAAGAGNSGGIGIVNEYAYVVAVKLTETDTPIAPELNLRKVEPALINYKTAVVATVQNSTASIIKDMDIRAEIFENNANTPLHESAQDGVDMAPNSVLEYEIGWDNTQIKPGAYSLHMTATHGEKTWEWNEPFTIGTSQSEDVNNGAIDLAPDSWLAGAIVYIAVGATIVLLALLVAMARRRGRRKRIADNR